MQKKSSKFKVNLGGTDLKPAFTVLASLNGRHIVPLYSKSSISVRLEIAKRLRATYNVTNVVFEKRKESLRFNSIQATSESTFRF